MFSNPHKPVSLFAAATLALAGCSVTPDDLPERGDGSLEGAGESDGQEGEGERGDPPRCGAGTVEKAGVCVPAAEGIRCGAGTVERDGECVVQGAACVGDDACPRGLFCIAGACRERACEPAARRCADEEIEVCNGAGLAWDFRRVCDRGCTEGACAPAVCPPSALRCTAQDGVEQCDAVGSGWQPLEACDLGCTAGRCRGGDGGGGGGDPGVVCDPGDRRCDEDTVLECNDAQAGWAFVQGCETACAAGACVPAACQGGARRCTGPMLEQCDARGLGWTVLTVCEGGCSASECQAPPVEGGGCPDALRRCVGDALELCANRQWSLVEVCEAGCRGGDCVDPICQPGARRCDASGFEVEICSADGTEWRFRRACDTSCDRGECRPRICQAFVRRCNGLLPQQCDPTGTSWIDGAPCQAACSEGICDRVPDGGCLPGRERCDGDTRERCSQNFAWELVQECDAACIAGECATCRPNALRCPDDGAVERCAGDGGEWLRDEVCAVGCIDGQCTECIPGQRRCNGAAVEVCQADGQGFAGASLCLTACDAGGCTACTPNALRCNGRTAEQCQQDGAAWQVLQECGGRCEGGLCAGEAVCEPGMRRCSQADVQVCTPDAAGWLTLESCMTSCDGGACSGAACLPFDLTVTPSALPADGASSALVVSGRLLDIHGRSVPDGTLFTLELQGATGLTVDGDPNTEGVQVRSLNGRIDFAIRAPQEPGEIVVSAIHPIAQRCQGTVRPQAVEAGDPTIAVDFTDDDLNDVENTTALWDTILGRVDPFPSDFGGGEDGELVVDSTYNLNQHSQPGRLFPDAVNFNVEALGGSSATVEGGVGGIDIGDEVLLINLQGSAAGNGNVGNYELLEVARIDYGLNTLNFTTLLRRLYGLAETNDDLTGQKIMLQRVPHYTDVTVRSTLTANAWDGERGGVVFFKALGQVAVDSSSIHANALGYRAAVNRRGESYAGWPEGQDSTANFGGGGAHPDNRYSCGGGGGYATAGRDSQGNDRGGRGGGVYGDEGLDKWFLGSAGGSGRSNYSNRSGGGGGGILVVWAGGIAVRGSVSARGVATGGCWHGGPGAGGTIFLRGRSLNVGNGRVTAQGYDYGGSSPKSSDGRIRLDFFGLAGTTVPPHHPGFAGDTIVHTLPLDHAVVPITTATLQRVVSDERGGRLTYQISNNDQQWFEVAPGQTVEFGNAVGNDLQLQVSFTNDNLQPLTLNGFVLSYTEADP